MQERRCAQIAELLARGVKGVALSSAVQAWDKESGVGTVSDGMFVAEEGGVVDSQSPRIAQNDARGRKEMWRAKDTEVTTTATTTTTTKTRSASIAQQARFNVPLTSMFRRASSVPLALVPDHEIAVQNATAVTIWAPDHTQDSVGGVVPNFYPPPLSPASSISYESEVSFPDSDNTSFPAMFDFVPFSPPDSPCSSIMDNNNNNQNQNHDLVTLGPINPLLSIVGPAGPATDPSTLNHFFSVSSYSSLCDWAGADTLTVTAAATATDNYGAKMPSLTEISPTITTRSRACPPLRRRLR
ncbi:hypothetical protein B0F90DRAFT_1349216 [Multifurca ochricompacta]|uniref:Uncharacterized protein n=1 Tax=Multifurca ochricompacta TaxID=376703 RepID=A0AAD4LXW1_9AGAM|nr:hypothetical protein B0F90DRAFT_1349216 [Multifurca ochricompacta]